MSTNTPRTACPALFGKARRAILAITYGRPEEAFYLRQLARAAGVGLGAVQRELARLAGAGILTRTVSGKQVYFQANPACPVFDELRDLMLKTAALGDVLRAALAPMAGGIVAAFVHGPLATGEAGKGVAADLMVVGTVPRMQVLAAVTHVEERLGRPLRVVVHSPAEFRRLVAAGDAATQAALDGPKIHLIGE